jgi:hypothetical protein
VMSNHHHMVVSDPNGVLPDFLREFHRTMAKAINASQGQWSGSPARRGGAPTDPDVQISRIRLLRTWLRYVRAACDGVRSG